MLRGLRGSLRSQTSSSGYTCSLGQATSGYRQSPPPPTLTKITWKVGYYDGRLHECSGRAFMACGLILMFSQPDVNSTLSQPSTLHSLQPQSTRQSHKDSISGQLYSRHSSTLLHSISRQLYG